jgi:hypothetical protein
MKQILSIVPLISGLPCKLPKTNKESKFEQFIGGALHQHRTKYLKKQN